MTLKVNDNQYGRLS